MTDHLIRAPIDFGEISRSWTVLEKVKSVIGGNNFSELRGIGTTTFEGGGDERNEEECRLGIIVDGDHCSRLLSTFRVRALRLDPREGSEHRLQISFRDWER
jgi:hypothetical protein